MEKEISEKIYYCLADLGMDFPSAIDAVLGEGAYEVIYKDYNLEG